MFDSKLKLKPCATRSRVRSCYFSITTQTNHPSRPSWIKEKVAAMRASSRELGSRDVSTIRPFTRSLSDMSSRAPQTDTNLQLGPATDYSANMAQFVHNRRPQYKGTMGFEMERPSASYVIDVSLCSASAQIDDAIKSCVLTRLVDAPTTSPQRQCSRLSTGQTFAFIFEQDAPSCQRGEVDARRETSAYWFNEWRIHPLERNGVQF